MRSPTLYPSKLVFESEEAESFFQLSLLLSLHGRMSISDDELDSVVAEAVSVAERSGWLVAAIPG